MGWKPSSGSPALALSRLRRGDLPLRPGARFTYASRSVIELRRLRLDLTALDDVQGHALSLRRAAVHPSLLPCVWIDFRDIRDRHVADKETDYFRNTQTAIAVQRDYTDRNPGHFVGYAKDIWGLSACDGPNPTGTKHSRRYSPKVLGYAARGAPLGPDDGTIAPWGPLSCLPFDRQAALDGTKALLDAYPNLLLDGRFPGGFNPSVKGPGPEGRGRRDRSVAIDQGLLVMMIENERTGLIWNLMRQSSGSCAAASNEAGFTWRLARAVKAAPHRRTARIFLQSFSIAAITSSSMEIPVRQRRRAGSHSAAPAEQADIGMPSVISLASRASRVAVLGGAHCSRTEKAMIVWPSAGGGPGSSKSDDASKSIVGAGQTGRQDFHHHRQCRPL